MDTACARSYVRLLRSELVCALGCTEPIALAYAAALAARVLGAPCDHVSVACSGNIIKNVKSVAVPNAEGMKGVECAATLGVIGGDPTARLQVLQAVTHDDVERTRDAVARGFCDVELVEGVPNLHIVATVRGMDAAGARHEASVTISERHTNVTRVTYDGADVAPERVEAICPGALDVEPDGCGCAGDAREEGAGTAGDEAPRDGDAAGGEATESCEEVKASLTMERICDFARTADLDALPGLREVLERQIACNTAISQEGLSGHWGSEIGRTIMATRPIDVTTRMRARAAAGSDARMGGCSLPVVINSGSGNQGVTVSLPVIEYAETVHAPHDQLLRALALANLCALHLKHYIGSLSAFCGVVCAAAGAGAGVTYLAGGTTAQIGSTVVNTLANVGGIMCDGAKASCAAKIASAVDAAMLGHQMAMLGDDFCAGDGLVASDVETTIMSMGYVGRVGMRDTDNEILKIMIGKTGPEEMRC